MQVHSLYQLPHHEPLDLLELIHLLVLDLEHLAQQVPFPLQIQHHELHVQMVLLAVQELLLVLNAMQANIVI